MKAGALVVAQKIVSKAEGRVVALSDVTPSAEAAKLAAEDGRDYSGVAGPVILVSNQRLYNTAALNFVIILADNCFF